MKFYFSTRNIPGLEDKSLLERMTLLNEAAKAMTIPEKTIFNVLKLIVLVPVFVLILRVVEDWTSLLWAALVLLLYPLIVKPIQHSLCAKYIKKES
ncbi:DUF6170 family protein [Opacimonas viscosa]|uniref:DUF6170 family protein n=1 Tax=Opacimonas viscosa TaxID=2961944 RepID=A0AA42BKL0_9ALTE|nr:DUF6170 family protein [Opacimonas viscosa]MCP3427749.1 DUF6170 family protein [Opacimonas viscosa]